MSDKKDAQQMILLVEDDDAIRLTLRDFLKAKGFYVFVASDGVGAIKALLDHPEINIIISDYRMDIFGGDYWIKFLHQYCVNKKIIITSGFLKPEIPIPFKVIFKPFEYRDIEEALKSLSQE